LCLTVLEACSLEMAFESIMRLRPAAVVLDVEPFRPDTLELIRLVARSYRALPVVATTLNRSEALERAVLEAGARYYVPDVTSTSGNEAMQAILLARAQAPDRTVP